MCVDPMMDSTTLSRPLTLSLGLSIFIVFFLSSCDFFPPTALLVFEYDTFIGVYVFLFMYDFFLQKHFHLLEEAVCANNCFLF